MACTLCHLIDDIQPVGQNECIRNEHLAKHWCLLTHHQTLQSCIVCMSCILSSSMWSVLISHIGRCCAALTHFSQRRLENTASLNNSRAAPPPQTHTYTLPNSSTSSGCDTTGSGMISQRSLQSGLSQPTAATDKIYLIHRLYNGVRCQQFDTRWGNASSC